MEKQQAENSGHHLTVIYRCVCSRISEVQMAKCKKKSCEFGVLSAWGCLLKLHRVRAGCAER